MATETVRAKVRLAGRSDVLTQPGRSLLPGEFHRFAPNEDLSPRNASQCAAACAVADTGSCVTSRRGQDDDAARCVRGAHVATAADARCFSHAKGGIGADSRGRDRGIQYSCPALGPRLPMGHRRGRREGMDRASSGRSRSHTRAVYGGPTQYVVRSRDRIVVDEAGMVDLQTANVLVELAIEQGVGLAFVSDMHQALPVGHAGAMGSAIRRANAAAELDTVHRFRDPDYAALTLRLRDAGDHERALTVAGELAEHGHVDRVDHHDAARERMIDAYFEWHARGKRVALLSGTNAEADAINDAIHQRRVDQAELDVRVAAWGVGEQRILVGDTVQTRRNDRLTGVENRAQWIVRRSATNICLLSPWATAARCGECSPRTRASTCRSPTRPSCTATPPTRRWSVRMWMPLDSMWASRAGGCTTLRSSSDERIPRAASVSPSRCSAALRS